MLGTISGKDEPAKRLGSSIAAALLAVSQGANIVRCHDVAATVDAIKVWCYFSGGGGVIRPPAESDS
jgi:dihydropteroate synthase